MPNYKGLVWEYFRPKNINNKTVYTCKFCDQTYCKNATRMTLHLKKCNRCPTNVREKFSKRNKFSKGKITRVIFFYLNIYTKRLILLEFGTTNSESESCSKTPLSSFSTQSFTSTVGSFVDRISNNEKVFIYFHHQRHFLLPSQKIEKIALRDFKSL